MKKILTLILFIGALILLVSLNYCDFAYEQKGVMYKHANDIQKVITLFDTTPEKIKIDTKEWIASAQKDLDAIINIEDNKRTYANTIDTFDKLVSLSDMAIGLNILQGLELLHPDDALRAAAHESSLEIQAWYVEHIANNKGLYDAIKAYAGSHTELLSDEQNYFITETVDGFERAGLNLPEEQLAQVKALNKEIQELSASFEKNIATDNRTISVTKDELTGISDEFIAQLKTDESGNYILGVDYPTYFHIMDNCTNSQTRKKLWVAFNNRAYPNNDTVLKKLLQLRDQKAKLLGFNSYAEYNLVDQMVLSPERADAFLHDLVAKSKPKVEQEFAMLTKQLPEGVTLTDEGKLYPWDYSFVVNQYKKHTLAIDEEKIKEYFPMEHTIDQLLDIYRQFLNVEFVQVPLDGANLWHEGAQALQVYDKTKTNLLGTLFLDLHPRNNKYSHACHATMIPGVTLADGTVIPDVSIVIANFPKATGDKPALLKRDDVSTFFHEFGHAIHAILGNTRVASFSGTSTKTDFVELPSQMLEEWLWDTDILKKVSRHYKTGESLPDKLIAKIQQNKTLLTGHFVQRQSYLSLLCLSYYASGEHKDVFGIMKELYNQYRPHVQFDDNDHFYAAYGHLPSYAAKYYGYLWSKVFALDVFAQIKKQGLLNGEIGQKYVDTILSKGGSKDPNQLLIDFIGREPNSEAFFEDMGL